MIYKSFILNVIFEIINPDCGVILYKNEFVGKTFDLVYLYSEWSEVAKAKFLKFPLIAPPLESEASSIVAPGTTFCFSES